MNKVQNTIKLGGNTYSNSNTKPSYTFEKLLHKSDLNPFCITKNKPKQLLRNVYLKQLPQKQEQEKQLL